MTDGTGPSKSQGLRNAISNKLRLGKGGNKSRRGSSTRTSAIVEATHMASGSSHGSHGGSLESLSVRLRNLREAGDLAEQPPFRIKFVNHKNDATMADVYPTEEYKDVIRKIVEKLRMPHQSNYVLMYKDTDDEEIGVACTDNLREMFNIFEPGSKLQLRIVQQTINNSGALDSIPSIWDNGHTPNVFLHDSDSGSEHGSESSGDSVDLGKLKLASAAATAAVEMEEKPKVSSHTHLAVEDVAETAVAAAAAASAAAAAAALADAVGTKTEKQGNSNASNKAEPPTPVSPASPQVSPKVDDKPPPEDELRSAIAMMSNNLTLAIESLGTKLATNFDRLSNEQAKIIDSLAHAKTTVSVESKVVEKVAETVAAAAAVAAVAAVAAAADDSDSDSDSDSDDEKKTKVDTKTEEKVEAKVEEKAEEKVEIKVEEKVETKTETKTDEGVTETTTVETKTTEIKVEDVEADKKEEEKEEDKKEEKKEEAAPPAPPAKDTCETETINVEIIDEAPPAPAPTPAPVHVHHKTDDCEEKRRADIFKEHLHRANAFAFPTNPYASSFFQHGFSEVGMPSYIRHPCMLQTPFDERACSCSGGCSVCLTRKLAEMGYGVNEMQVSSLLGMYNGDTARVIDHVTSC
ncbi:hypothetical protein H4S04_005626 [Coemansia sp. S16]|nr:hypothetical protein H4S04_005626 [Coemansia sp. S16]KAJ2059758.1 hypothetical protein GGI08_003171 [Coemansia sp. S2]